MELVSYLIHTLCIYAPNYKLEIHVVYVHDISTTSRGSSVGITTGYGLDDRGSGVCFSAGGGGGNIYLLHRVQTGIDAHRTSYLMGTGGSFPGGRAAGA
jgi:hypothetical protein